MNDEAKTKDQLLAEIEDLRLQIAAREQELTAELQTVNDLLAAEIGERKRAEQKARENEALFKALFKGLPIPVYIWRRDGDYLILRNYNAAALEATREGILELAGITASRLFANEPEILKNIGRSFSERTSLSLEKEYRYKTTGEKRRLVATFTYMPPDLVSVSTEDITERHQAKEALRVSEERLGLALRGSELGFWDWDIQTGDLVVNRRSLKSLGYPVDTGKVKYDMWTSQVHPDDMPKIIERQKEHIEGRTPIYECEHRLKAAWGEWRSIFAQGKLVARDEAGRPLRMVGTHRDLTDKKKTEQALRESEARYQFLFEESPICIWELDISDLKASIEKLRAWGVKDFRAYFESHPQAVREISFMTKFIDVNKACLELFGAKSKEHFYDGIKKTFLGETFKVTRNILVDLAEGRTRYDIEYRTLTFEGKRIDIAYRASHFLGQNGGSRGIVSMINISKHIRAEEALRKSEETARALLNATPDAAALLDPEARALTMNETFARRFGRNIKNMTANDPLNYLPPKLKKSRMELLKKVFETGRAMNFEDQRAGMYLSNILFPILGLDGRVERVALFSRDITNRKRAEEQLEAYQAQLRHMASELAVAEARERRQIATDLHDRIGQTLFLAKMKVEGIQESGAGGQVDHTALEAAGLIKQAIQDLRTLIVEISPPILYELGFVPALRWLADNLESNHNLTVDIQDDGQPKPLTDDMRDLLFRAVRELTMNVVKHSRACNLRLAVFRTGKEIQVNIEDDGVGFKASAYSSGKNKNNEFGIFSIHERLKPRGGRLVVESEPGCGTRAMLVVPIKG